MRKKPKGGQQITIFLTTDQCEILKKLADAQEYPSNVTKVARKVLQNAIAMIADNARSNPA